MSIMNSFQLEGKVALVTGCRCGIGFAIAEGLAEAGADIIGVSASLPPEGSEIEEAVTAKARRFSSYQCNLSDREALTAFVAKVKADHPDHGGMAHQEESGLSE